MHSALRWQKSSFSGGGSGDNCLELAAPPTTPHIHLRESETPGTILTTAPHTFDALITALKGDNLNAPNRGAPNPSAPTPSAPNLSPAP